MVPSSILCSRLNEHTFDTIINTFYMAPGGGGSDPETAIPWLRHYRLSLLAGMRWPCFTFWIVFPIGFATEKTYCASVGDERKNNCTISDTVQNYFVVRLRWLSIGHATRLSTRDIYNACVPTCVHAVSCAGKCIPRLSGKSGSRRRRSSATAIVECRYQSINYICVFFFSSI